MTAFDEIYPVGSIYISVSAELPANFTERGRTWEKLASGRCLWTAASNSQLGTTLKGSLPNITGRFDNTVAQPNTTSSETNPFNAHDAFSPRGAVDELFVATFSAAPLTSNNDGIKFDASLSNSVYEAEAGKNVVRPTSIAVNMWKRTA